MRMLTGQRLTVAPERRFGARKKARPVSQQKRVGLNFEELLQSLGVPAAPNRADAPYGALPSGYTTSW